MSLVQSKQRKHALERGTPGAQSSELSRHLLRAQEEERKRISRELHDGTGQGLMVLRLYLGMLASESQSTDSQHKIHEALKLLDHTVEDLRRMIGRLSPRTLEELGLLAAIRKEIRDVSRNTEIKAHLELPEQLEDLEHEIEVGFYRSLQEALHNIVKHSRAKSFVVRLRETTGWICLSVEDDGIGFLGKHNSRSQSFGLSGMRQRIAALGGKVRIQSGEAKGTRIKVSLPIRLGAANRRKLAAAQGSSNGNFPRGISPHDTGGPATFVMAAKAGP